MKPFKPVHVGGFEYPITVKRLHDSAGRMFYHHPAIELNDEYSEEYTCKVLTHEIAHAVHDRCGVDLADESLDSAHEQVSRTWYAFLRDKRNWPTILRIMGLPNSTTVAKSLSRQ